MIVEGLLTTTDTSGNINVAPMGPVVHGNFRRLTLRPFHGSTTFDNLLATKAAVFHVVDRVHVIAEAAIRKLSRPPEHEAARHISGIVLQDCCRWFELQVTAADTSELRSVMDCEIVHTGDRRPFWGFNRGRHAIIEAAILCTRLHLLPQADVESQMDILQSAVEKTGGDEETETFRMLADHMAEYYAGVPSV